MDLDGVLHDYNSAFRKLVKDRWGVELRPSDSWDSFQTQMVDEQGLGSLWDYLWSGAEVGYLLGEPYEGAVEACWDLEAMGAEVVLITHRSPMARAATFWWLAQHGVPTSEVHLLGHGGEARPKSSVECDVYVDDGPHVVNELLESTQSHVVCWDQPWNQAGVKARAIGYTRTSSWDDVKSVVSLAQRWATINEEEL